MGKSNNASAPRWLNIVSLMMLIPAVSLAFFRFGPARFRMQVNNLAIYAWGDTVGCGLTQVLQPDEGIREIGYRIDETIQIIEQEDGLVHWKSSSGRIWAPKGNNVVFLLAEQALDAYQAGPVKVQPGDVVLDCGANIGTFSRLALDAGAAHVVMIEPSPLNVKALLRNFAGEIADGRVSVIPKALWSEPGNMMLLIYDNSLLDSLVMNDRGEGLLESEVDVELVTIDALVAELGLKRVDFIKMDIEGAERNALNGAAETLRRFRPRMAIATENLPDDIHAVPATVNELAPGYQLSAGSCREIRPGMIRPEVVYFTPAAVARAGGAAPAIRITQN